MAPSENTHQQDKLDGLIQEFREEYGTCLDWIFSELKEPENLGYSEVLMELFKPYSRITAKKTIKPIIRTNFWNSQNLFDKNAMQIKKFDNRMRIKKLALENLAFPIPYDIFVWIKLNTGKNLDYLQIMQCYFWLERLYYISTKKELCLEDALNIYFGGLMERIMLELDKFNELNYIPEIDSEFFQKLKNITEIDNKATTFKEKSGNIIEMAIERSSRFNGFYNFPHQPKYEGLKDCEEMLLYCFASFSAATANRQNIIINDYITAYKIYYKLLKIDLTEYKCQEELFHDKYHGYLVCESCGSYYELKRGENPNEFSNKCNCGGNLKYERYLNDDRHIKWKVVTINSLIITIILTTSFVFIPLIYYVILIILFYYLLAGFFEMFIEHDKRGLIIGTSLITLLSYILSFIILYLYFPKFSEMSMIINISIFTYILSIIALNLIIAIKTPNK